MNSEPLDVALAFDAIGPEFDATRQRVWPEVKGFIGRQEGGKGTALDIGTGNGRHLEILRSSGYRPLGLDISKGMLAQAHKNVASAHLLLSHFSYLPLREKSADLVLAIAVVHHLSTREARVRAMNEMARVLKSGAPGMISVWKHPEIYGTGDQWVDWHSKKGVVRRYYYMYTREELEQEAGESGLEIEDIYSSGNNLYLETRG